ncbi:MAG: type II toxin-antitoxin system Phd/YefM family antitoxin [Planctomycetota bacterium]|nr:type II toxin-antitoxin system Phd/YefM family antitoxin [Planctomycetota bacterium]
MTAITATDARRDFFSLVKRATKGHHIYRIRHRSGAAVLLSEEDYESLLETLELLAIPGFRASMKRSVAQMKRGDTLPFEAVLGAKE